MSDCDELLDRLERNLEIAVSAMTEAEAEIARLRAALTQIRDREHPYPQFSWAMGIASLALISGRPHDAAEGEAG